VYRATTPERAMKLLRKIINYWDHPIPLATAVLINSICFPVMALGVGLKSDLTLFDKLLFAATFIFNVLCAIRLFYYVSKFYESKL
jgi:small basic protein